MDKRKLMAAKSSKKKFVEEDFFDLIEDRAYKLWDQDGKPQGKDWQYWFRAEKEVKYRLRKLGVSLY